MKKFILILSCLLFGCQKEVVQPQKPVVMLDWAGSDFHDYVINLLNGSGFKCSDFKLTPIVVNGEMTSGSAYAPFYNGTMWIWGSVANTDDMLDICYIGSLSVTICPNDPGGTLPVGGFSLGPIVVSDQGSESSDLVFASFSAGHSAGGVGPVARQEFALFSGLSFSALAGATGACAGSAYFLGYQIQINN